MTREQDAKVARMLGWTVRQVRAVSGTLLWALHDPKGEIPTDVRVWEVEYYGEAEAWESVPHYSTDIAAAWTLVEYMRQRDWLYGIGDDDQNTADQYACFYRDGSGPISAVGKTAPAAIVAAFLAVKEPKE